MASRERRSFRTPDNVRVELPVGGLGSRLLAHLLDLGLIAGVLLVILIGLFYLAGQNGELTTLIGTVIAGSALLLYVLICAAFEGLTGGRTPGKRAFGLRVVRHDTGAAIGVTEALIRNLFRIIDILFGIGPLVMFATAESRRIGDFAAGTMVIRERASSRDRTLALPPQVALRVTAPGPPITGLERMGAKELTALRAYLARPDLHPLQRARIARDLRDKFATRLDLPVSATERAEHPELFLERMYLQLAARERA